MNNSLRILAVHWRCLRNPQAGGAEINLFEQAKRWTREGHQVTIVCADPGRKYAPQKIEVIDGITVRRMGNWLTVPLLALLFYYRNVGLFDRIVDISHGIPFFTPLFSNIPGVLIVHHIHGCQWFDEFPYPIAIFGWFLERKIVPLVYRYWPIITVSPTTRDALIELGFDPTKIYVVYNGMQMPMELPSRPSPLLPRIAYVGRLKRYKRLDRLVRIVSNLRRRIPKIHLDIAGDGDAREEIAAMVENLNLQDCVTLHGYVDEQTKAMILSSASVFAMPSSQEGWGLSVIEANAYGCPAVAFDVPGLSVAIRDGVTGFLAQDDLSFENALATIIQDQALRDQLSLSAIAWASRFSWENCANNTIEVLQAWGNPESIYRGVKTS